jgi:hypothetical protein
MRIEFSDEERGAIQRLVATALQDIRLEVRHSHESDTRAELRHRENLYREILDKVEVGAPAVVGV